MAPDEITVHRGENQLLNLTLEDDDGNTLDLTKADKVTFEVWTEQGLTPNYEEGQKIFSTDATNLTGNGTCDVTIDSTDTGSEDTGLYVFQVTVLYPSQNYTAVTGDFFIKQDLA